MMLSSAGPLKNATLCRDLGVAAYLTKPVKPSELLQTMLATLGALAPDRLTAHGGAVSAPAERPLKILLAEDNAVNQLLATFLLEKRGHRVLPASNGREALKAWETQRFDLILMDVQMPEINGFETTGLIRTKEKESGGHIPIIAMTAHAMKGDRERCLEAGMDAYLSKPIQPRELLHIIERLFPARTAIQEGELEPMSPASCLDREALLARVGNKPENLTKLVKVFDQESAQLLAAIRRGLDKNDAANVRKAAHALKGAVGVFEMAAATDAARHFEAACLNDLGQAAEQAYQTLIEALDRLRPALQGLMGDLPLVASPSERH
jgi:CheY-like chemotaxis protein